MTRTCLFIAAILMLTGAVGHTAFAQATPSAAVPAPAAKARPPGVWPVARQPDFNSASREDISDYLRFGTLAKPAIGLGEIFNSACVGDLTGQCQVVGRAVLNETKNMFIAIGNMCHAFPADPSVTGDAVDLPVVYCLRTALMEYSKNVEGAATAQTCGILAKRQFALESVLCFSKGLVLSEIPACDAKNPTNAAKKQCFLDTLGYVVDHSDKGRLISARGVPALTPLG